MPAGAITTIRATIRSFRGARCVIACDQSRRTVLRHGMNALAALSPALLLPYTSAFAAEKSHYEKMRQQNWRFCNKCFLMFWNGGACAGGGGHQAQGYTFQVDLVGPGDSLAGDKQYQWAVCDQCRVLFFGGYKERGRCANPDTGGAHWTWRDNQFHYGLWKSPGHATKMQDNWRFCTRCYGLFFDGYADKGKCPAGGGHTAQGYNFYMEVTGA